MVLFGSRPAKTSQSDFESVQVLLPLAPPSGAAILSLERLLGDHGSATLEAEVGDTSLFEMMNITLITIGWFWIRTGSETS